jgi:hypothetical protein
MRMEKRDRIVKKVSVLNIATRYGGKMGGKEERVGVETLRGACKFDGFICL